MTNLKIVKLNILITMSLTMGFFSLNAQNTIEFYKVIEGDSVAMFFNDNNKYVDRKCATYVRYTRLDKAGNFNGFFKDYQQNPSVLRSTGFYLNGRKNGIFTLFYANGKIQSRGEYVDNKPQGIWEFFHDNGLPERQMSITERDTLLVRLISENGKILVDNGEGEFEGLVSGNFASKNEILAKGKILNGKPVGKWTSTLQNKSFCNEEFDDHGKFIKGVFPESQFQKKKPYQNKSFLANQIQANYLNSIEAINLEGCSDGRSNKSLKLDFDANNFNDDLRKKLNELWIEDIRAHKYETYQEEETHYMTVEFDIENSKFNNFKLITNWGSEFYNTVVWAIKRKVKPLEGTGKIYFHLRLISRGTQYYRWTFNFSPNKEIKF